jgi:redox-sensitive bicupin YhaK (pirin superfamily)
MRANDVQVMSAGKGVFHSEVNHSKQEAVKLFQIWVFPDRDNVEPRYEQKSFSVVGRKNQWQEIIKPASQNEGEAIFIYQDAWFSLSDLDAGKEISYSNHKAQNVLYLFVIEGDVEVNGEKLKQRDAIGVSEYNTIQIKASTNARLLAMDVPQINLQ